MQYGFDDSILDVRCSLLLRTSSLIWLQILCQPTPTQDAQSHASERGSNSTQALIYQDQPSTAFGGPEEKLGFKGNKDFHPDALAWSSNHEGKVLGEQCHHSVRQDSRSEISRWVESSAQRSVQLLNLIPGVTHGDIAAIVRGGPLLEIFLRARDNTATVSFVRESDAVAFFDHTQTHGLYFKDRKVG